VTATLPRARCPRMLVFHIALSLIPTNPSVGSYRGVADAGSGFAFRAGTVQRLFRWGRWFAGPTRYIVTCSLMLKSWYLGSLPIPGPSTRCRMKAVDGIGRAWVFPRSHCFDAGKKRFGCERSSDVCTLSTSFTFTTDRSGRRSYAALAIEVLSFLICTMIILAIGPGNAGRACRGTRFRYRVQYLHWGSVSIQVSRDRLQD
jgi:hypothetical protein